MRGLAIALCLCALLAAVPQARAAQPIITVMDFSGSGVSQGELSLFSDYITSHIVETGQYVVVDRLQRMTLLQEIEFSNSDCTDERCQLEIGRVLAANKIIVGSLGRFGDRFILNIKLIEVETGRTENAASRTYASLSDLLEDSRALTMQLLGAQAPVPATPEPAPVAKVQKPEQTTTAVEYPAPIRVPGPALIKEVPVHDIRIDGDYSDWGGLQPAFLDVAGDCIPEVGGFDIIEVYLAKDPKFIYVYFLLHGKGLPASDADSMWADVILDIGDEKMLNLSVYYEQFWKAGLGIYHRRLDKYTQIAQGMVMRRGKGFEARFPISYLYESIQQGKEYPTQCRIVTHHTPEIIHDSAAKRKIVF